MQAMQQPCNSWKYNECSWSSLSTWQLPGICAAQLVLRTPCWTAPVGSDTDQQPAAVGYGCCGGGTDRAQPARRHRCVSALSHDVVTAPCSARVPPHGLLHMLLNDLPDLLLGPADLQQAMKMSTPRQAGRQAARKKTKADKPGGYNAACKGGAAKQPRPVEP